MGVNTTFYEFPIISTERLLLRNLKNKDRNYIYDIFSSELVMKYYGTYPLMDLSTAEELIMNFNEDFENGSSIRWGIELKSNGAIIGTCGYHHIIPKFSKAEIGYELSDRYWGQGYMKEALHAIISYGFSEMLLNRIEALVYPENTVSQCILLNNGFRREGLLRQFAYFRDRYQDLIMFSLLRDDAQ